MEFVFPDQVEEKKYGIAQCWGKSVKMQLTQSFTCVFEMK